MEAGPLGEADGVISCAHVKPCVSAQPRNSHEQVREIGLWPHTLCSVTLYFLPLKRSIFYPHPLT